MFLLFLKSDFYLRRLKAAFENFTCKSFEPSRAQPVYCVTFVGQTIALRLTTAWIMRNHLHNLAHVHLFFYPRAKFSLLLF